MAKIVSRTYGEALFELAVEENKVQEMLEEIRAIQAAFAENPDFDKLMKHPGISKQEKLQVIKDVFRNRVSDHLTGFLEIVISKERYHDLAEIFAYFTEKVKELQKIGVAYVETATELTQDQKKKICDRLLETTAYETMEMNYKVDPSLIGGMVIRVNDRVVDSSIKTKLSNMTKQLLV